MFAFVGDVTATVPGFPGGQLPGEFLPLSPLFPELAAPTPVKLLGPPTE